MFVHYLPQQPLHLPLLLPLLHRLQHQPHQHQQPYQPHQHHLQQPQGLLVQPLGDWLCLLLALLLVLLWALHLLVLVRYQALLPAQALQPLRGWLAIQLSAGSIVSLEQSTHCQLMQWKTC
jgi:hypothetical protein